MDPQWYPEMRAEIELSVSMLADVRHQREIWLKPVPGTYDCLDYVIHWLFDDTNIASDPHGCIGWYLRNESEAKAFTPLLNLLSSLIDELGDAPDSHYLAHEAWVRVVEEARRVQAELCRPARPN